MRNVTPSKSPRERRSLSEGRAKRSLKKNSETHRTPVTQLRDEWLAHRTEILERLEAFQAVPPSRYFYELCYCIMTPQSSATQCNAVVDELRRRKFHRTDFDVETLLRSHNGGYVRFHKTKALRLHALKHTFPLVKQVLTTEADDKRCRNVLTTIVSGLGFKEASHFLRNIGRFNVAIIDRHILRNLIRFGLITEWPKSLSQRRYFELEAIYFDFAERLRIPASELDLILWKRETGFLFK